jgi:hypothetical protein
MPQMIPLEAWIQLLNKFLTDAEKSVQSGTASDRDTVRTKLFGFIKSTPPQYEFLDDIARDALKNLNNASLDMAANNIRNVANELEKQRLIIGLATKEAQASASEIKLEQLAKNIEQATAALENLKEINAILNDDDKAFDDKVKDVQAKLKELKDN